MSKSMRSSAQKSFLERNGLLLIILLMLSVLAVGGRYLTGALITGTNLSRNTLDLTADTQQSCTAAGKGTMFDASQFSNVGDPDEIIAAYKNAVNQVINARLSIQETPEGYCESPDFEEGSLGSSSALQSLANGLPGLDISEPITYSSLAPVLLELQRVYECVLIGIIHNSTHIVFFDGYDKYMDGLPKPAVGLFEVPRVDKLRVKLQTEMQKSRAALERTLSYVRAIDMSAPLSFELHCLQRQAADLRNGMSLLSDAVSCMPKIFDPVTSLHERYREPPKEEEQEESSDNQP